MFGSMASDKQEHPAFGILSAKRGCSRLSRILRPSLKRIRGMPSGMQQRWVMRTPSEAGVWEQLSIPTF